MFLRKKSDSYTVLSANLRQVFTKIKGEFSEHLQAINENTNEIQANYEYLCEVDAKIDKLAERLDEISLFMKQQDSAFQNEEGPEITPLTKREQEVFQALYTLVNEKGHASYRDVAMRCGLPEALVQSYVTNLVGKGVPIHKKYVGKDVFLLLDAAFRELQAKENMLQINEMISEKVIS